MYYDLEALDQEIADCKGVKSWAGSYSTRWRYLDELIDLRAAIDTGDAEAIEAADDAARARARELATEVVRGFDVDGLKARLGRLDEFSDLAEETQTMMLATDSLPELVRLMLAHDIELNDSGQGNRDGWDIMEDCTPTAYASMRSWDDFWDSVEMDLLTGEIRS